MARISKKELSQLLIVGFEGPLLPDFYYDWLKKGLGGIILFSRNIEEPQQLALLTDEIQYAARAHLPALIGADQEGGRVFRLCEPFTHLPTAELVGKAVQKNQSTDIAYQAARVTALELASMGIRLNFAPVLDVHSHPENPVIGDRAFSTDPKEVARIGIAMMRGFKEEGVMACGKHFPGHGRTAQDSHLELPLVSESMEVLQKEEMLPFQEAIREGLEWIMPAHVLYPALDKDWPATLSEKILKDQLRYRLEYRGLVISDDLEMKAMKGRYEWRQMIPQAINAGVDVLLVCKSQEDQESVLEALVDAVETKDIPLERIHGILKKIKKLKKKYLKNPRPFHQAEWQAIVGCAKHRDLVARFKERL